MTRDGDAGTPEVDDHPFTPPSGRPWDRCVAQTGGVRCGLGEAAHERTSSPYVPTAPRAPERSP